MTSELISQIDSLLALDANGCLVPHGIGGLARELLERCQVELNTRATPSTDTLAGLQRYDLDFHGLHGEDAYMRKDETGEYVLHSEAAKIIAAKDARIKELETDVSAYILSAVDQDKRRKALEAELAQIKAQEPVAYKVYGHIRPFFFRHEPLSDFEINIGFTADPLYAAPISDSLKAKCDRYEQALDRISKMDRSHGSWDTIAHDAVNIAGSALSSIATHKNTT
ncbi:hypothetical protein K1X45_15795 [Pseudochrobactrum sp. Wa41.01b-1]|uniref:hypothetical protein n=1 Tax=Pseudochrobactrum sp. Wa41.01b-1 TaxID=2864102 RepID=UPI001C68DD2C|nr:hypothetical protein [Pseudochrobactrum sp. Wa41.01b-1]QYM72870.1 hypothetical protein K1X45_15795 [Pseudochrobactrum sp. Wa41.01b-1]